MTNLQPVLYFDGKNDLVELTKYFPTINNAITIEFWAKVTSEPTAQTSVFEAYGHERQRILNVHLPWDDDGSKVIWDAGHQDEWDRIAKEIKPEEFQDIWVHWSFIKDATAGHMMIVRNGEVWHQESDKHRPLSGIEIFIIGSMVDGYHHWQGYLSDFRLWNIARTPEAIKKDMHHRLAGNEAGLVAYLPFDEGTGDSVSDKTGNVNDGAIYGPTWQQETLDLVEISQTCLLKNIGTQLILDIAAGQTTPGSAVWGHIFNGSDGQQWELKPDGIIKSKLGDLALDLQDIPEVSDFTTVVVNPINNSVTQKWEITNNGIIKNKSNNYALVLADYGVYKIAITCSINQSQPKPNEVWEMIDM